jgi:hypothetical protein
LHNQAPTFSGRNRRRRRPRLSKESRERLRAVSRENKDRARQRE